MVIKVNGYELNITRNQDIYIGGSRCGQMFINWEDLDESEKMALENIKKKAQDLILKSEQVLMPQNHCSVQ